MRDSKRSISALIKSGKHKRFKNLDYDFLEEGDRIARGEVDTDEGEASDTDPVPKRRSAARVRAEAERIGAETVPSAKKVPSSKTVPVPSRPVGTKSAVGAGTAISAKEEPTRAGAKRGRVVLEVGTDSGVGAEMEPNAVSVPGSRNRASSVSPNIGTKLVPGAVSVPRAESAPIARAELGQLSPVGTDSVPIAKAVPSIAESADTVATRAFSHERGQKFGQKFTIDSANQVGTDSVPTDGSLSAPRPPEAFVDAAATSTAALLSENSNAGMTSHGAVSAPSSILALGTESVPDVEVGGENVGAATAPSAASVPSPKSVPTTLKSGNQTQRIEQAASHSDTMPSGVGAESVPSTKTGIGTKAALGAKTEPRSGANGGESLRASRGWKADGVELVAVPRCLLLQLVSEDLSPREMRIFLAIVLECLANESGVAEISGNDLQARADVHRSHVFSALKAIVERGLVLKEKQDSAAKNLYRLNLAYFQTKSGVT